MEHVGGAVLAGLPPTEMSMGAFATVEARLGDVASSAAAKPARGAADLADVAGLPRLCAITRPVHGNGSRRRCICVPFNCPRGA